MSMSKGTGARSNIRWQVACHNVSATPARFGVNSAPVPNAMRWSMLPRCTRGAHVGSALFVLASSVWLAGCGASFPEPRTTVHANAAYVEVPYLPPAALVEVAGEPPSDACVWYDGHWVWRGDKYVWKRGGWTKVPEEVAYAPWKTLVLDDGRIMFAAGTWYDDSGREVPAPKVVKAAETPPNEATSEFDSPR